MFTLEMLRTLKGAPLAVLIALALTRQSTGAEYLARVTGYSYKPTQQALKLLADYGLVTQNSRYGWQIASDYVQLPFILPESSSQEPNIRNVKSGNNSNSISTTATTTIVERQGVRSAAAVNNEKESENFQLNLKTLKDCGIYQPKASEIAAKDWVTPEYIRRHVEYGNTRGDNLGLVIYRMLAGDPAPLSEDEKRTEYFRELNRKLNGFAGGEDDEEEE